MIANNPAANIKSPKIERKELEYLEIEKSTDCSQSRMTVSRDKRQGDT